jgi:Tfp pilus assembly protein PilX
MSKIVIKNNGSTLLITVLLLTSIIIIALNAANIIISGTKMSGVQERSTLAFYAAESGAERFLYEARKTTNLPATANADLYGTIILSNNSIYNVNYGTSSPDIYATSTGGFLETKRSINLNF